MSIDVEWRSVRTHSGSSISDCLCLAGPAHSRIPKKRTPPQGVGKRQLLMGTRHASEQNIQDLLINLGISDELNGISNQFWES